MSARRQQGVEALLDSMSFSRTSSHRKSDARSALAVLVPFIEHLRFVHFSLTVSCAALLIGLSVSDLLLERAEHELAEIAEFCGRFSPDASKALERRFASNDASLPARWFTRSRSVTQSASVPRTDGDTTIASLAPINFEATLGPSVVQDMDRNMVVKLEFPRPPCRLAFYNSHLGDTLQLTPEQFARVLDVEQFEYQPNLRRSGDSNSVSEMLRVWNLIKQGELFFISPFTPNIRGSISPIDVRFFSAARNGRVGSTSETPDTFHRLVIPTSTPRAIRDTIVCSLATLLSPYSTNTSHGGSLYGRLLGSIQQSTNHDSGGSPRGPIIIAMGRATSITTQIPFQPIDTYMSIAWNGAKLQLEVDTLRMHLGHRAVRSSANTWEECYSSFAEVYLKDSARFSGIDREASKERLELLAQLREGSIEMFGISVPKDLLGTVGIAIVLVVHAYFLLHLRRFRRIVGTRWRELKLPWIGLYGDEVSRLVTLASSAVLPFVSITVSVFMLPQAIPIPPELRALLLSSPLLAMILAVMVTVEWFRLWKAAPPPRL